MTALRSLTLIALTLSACGSKGPRPQLVGSEFSRGSERFHIAALPTPWQRLKAPGEADLAFYDPETHSVIGANATCRRHKDPPLGTLLNDLLIGTTDRKYLLEERVILDGREALHAVVSLRLDGVPLVYDAYVIKKDGCVYDLTLVATAAGYDVVADVFVDFVAGFRGAGENIRTAKRDDL